MVNGGPQEQTICKQLAAIGQANIQKENRKPYDYLQEWLKQHKDDAKYLWMLVTNGHLNALKGHYENTKDKPVLKGMNKWSLLQVKLKYECLLANNIMDASTMRQLKKHNSNIANEIFDFVTGCDPNRPIAAGIMTSKLKADISYRIKAVGPRADRIEVAGDTIDWSSCGCYVLIEVSGRKGVRHTFSSTEARWAFFEDEVVAWTKNALLFNFTF